MSTETIWIKGNAKAKSFDNGGSIINFSVNAAQIAELADEKGWCQLIMSEKKEVDQYGNTHSMKLNTWKPDENWKSNAGKPAASAPSEEDAPF